jgi:hypothetical protein
VRKRIDTFEERQRIRGQKQKATPEQLYYTCGCGSQLWFLLRNGDCVCANCKQAQARIIVNELAPVKHK